MPTCVMNFIDPHVSYKVVMNAFYVIKGKVIALIFFSENSRHFRDESLRKTSVSQIRAQYSVQ